MTARKPLVLISGSLQELPSTDSITTNGSDITLVTAQATTSGTAWDFTNIPSWVNRITVMLASCKESASSIFVVRIGSGSIDTTATYETTATSSGSGGNVTSGSTTATSFYLSGNNNSTYANSGDVYLTRQSGNTWTISGSLSQNGVASTAIGGVKTLSGALDRVRLTTSTGTDTGTNGSVSISYE